MDHFGGRCGWLSSSPGSASRDEFFGQMEDDSMYFSSAREIARGHGYVMLSVPGAPPATKYPVLYPWLLSWVWRLNPNFPANLGWAVAMNAGFVVLFLIAAFAFLRKLKGISQTAALIITAFCAVHPLVLGFSAKLLSDLPFAALALCACVFASRAIEDGSRNKNALVCGVFAGLSVLVRTLGIPVAFGLFVAIAMRKGWRKSALFAACVLPFFSILLARAIYIRPAPAPISTNVCADSWQMTWLYYTSYAGYWKADVLANHVFWATAKNDVWSILLQPGNYFFAGSSIRPELFAVVVLLIVSATAIRGLFRQTNTGGWQPIHFALAFYLLPLFVWNYPVTGRFLIPFLPLFVAGVWIEAQHLISMVRTSISRRGGAEDKVAAIFFCFVGGALLVGTGLSLYRGIRLLSENSQSRASILIEKRQAYNWLRENTPVDSRVLVYEDASSFLYSDRKSMRPTIFSPAGTVRSEILNAELSCLTSSANPIGAAYWIVSEDDFGGEWEPAQSRGREKESAITATLQSLFRSSHGNVRIYKLDSEGQPRR